MTSTTTEPRASLTVLGLLANCELAAFSRLAADAERAPGVSDRVDLARLGGAALARLERVEVRVEELGGRVPQLVTPYLGVFTDFDERTPASTWWERLLKAYVGYGVEEDLLRLLARSTDPTTRGMLEELLADDRHASYVVRTITEAIATDKVLGSRLALWGRRLVGEALGVVQRALIDHPELRGLVEPALPDDAAGDDLQQRVFSVLTAAHTRRMGRLGLTA